jgi:streptogrisin D
MPTPRHRRPASPRTRKVALSSLLAGAVAAALAGFLAVAPIAGASDRGEAALPPGVTDETGPAAYTPAIRVLAVRAMTEKLGLSTADATARLAALADRTVAARVLERELGPRTAGSYLDRATGQLVVNVTDVAAGQSVTAAGARARLVTRSMAQLQWVQGALDASGAVPGTSWAVDSATDTVTVQLSSAAEADPRTAGWVRTLANYGDAVQVVHTGAGLTTQAFLGGQAILNANGSGRCSSAFNAVRGAQSFVITAGHCTQAVQEWTDGSQRIGESDVVQFPGNDFGTIAVDDPFALDPRGAVADNGQTQPITGTTAVPVGGVVCKTGSTTGTTCGTVLAENTTVVYPEGTVTGLIQTDLCTQPGDSGGALFAGDQAQGLVSGGTTGSCDRPGFVSFFQPITEVLQATGLQLR